MISSCVVGEVKTEMSLAFPLFARFKGNDMVILFTADSVGTIVVSAPKSFPLGTHGKDWISIVECPNAWEILPKGTIIELTQE